MKKHFSIILLLALMLSMFSVSYAATVTIGTGTFSQGYPFYIYYGYGRSLSLYTADQIGQLGTIDALGWNVRTTNSALIPYKIYLKTTSETALTSMTWADFTGTATLVKEGSHTFNSGGWQTFTLATPFIYTGGNLLIGVEANYGGSGSSSIPTFYNSYGSDLHQKWYANDTPPTGNGQVDYSLPNVQITLSPLSPDPVFALNPTSWNFGSIAINSTASHTFTITNAGSGTLNVTGISPATDGAFSVTGAPSFPVSLATGANATFNIRYAPTATGNHTATFTISHTNGTSNLTVSGEAYDSSISSFPHLEDFDGTWSGTPAAPADWTVINADNDDYTWRQSCDYIQPAHSGQYTAYGSRNNNDWLITPPINLSGVNVRARWWDKVNSSTYPNSYKVMLSTTTPEIASFTTELANIVCSNTSWTRHTLNLDNYSGQTVYLAFHQYASNQYDYGFGIDDFLLEEMPTAPILVYTPTTMDFGTTKATHSTAYQNVTITNTGAATLNLATSNLSFVGTDTTMFEFDSTALPLALAADESGVIPVRYNPTAAGQHTATLRMSYAGANHDVALSGRAVGENALFESFEATVFPPPTWNTDNWTRSTTYATHGSASAYARGSTSAQYLLSTPLLVIENDSRLNFWIRCSHPNGRIQVVYSPDRVNWTQLGDDLTFATYDTWYNHDIDLSSMIPGNYYLGLRTSKANYHFFADMFIGPDVVSLAPGAPTLSEPEDGAQVSVYPTFTWIAPTTGGVPTSYNIYCDASNPPTTLIGTSTETSYTQSTALPFGSNLYWTVTGVNAVGEGEKAIARQLTTQPDITVSIYPFIEGFEEGQIHSYRVRNWNQRLDGGKTNYWIANLVNTNYNRTPRSGEFNATLQFNSNAWLMRPFELQAGTSYDVELWARQDGATAANATIGIYYGAEGTLEAMTNTIKPQTGVINGDYQHIQGSFTPASAGIHWIGIRGIVKTPATYLSIDDIRIRITPTGPILAYTPTTMDLGTTKANTPTLYQNLTVTNIGIGTLNLTADDISITGDDAAMFEFDPVNLPLALAADQSNTIPVRYNPTIEGAHAAILRMVYSGANHDVTLSGIALGENALLESFEGETFPPEGWTVYNVNGGNTWVRATEEPRTGAAHASIQWNDFAHNDWLITPKLAPTADNHTFSFYASDGSDYWSESFNVKLSTTNAEIASFTHVLAEVADAGAEYTLYSYDLSEFIGQHVYIAIQATAKNQFYLYIDDVSGPDMLLPDIYAGQQYNVGENVPGAYFISSHDLYEVPNFDGTTGPVAGLTNLDPQTSHIAAYNAKSGSFDLTFTVSQPGTYYLMGYWNGNWNQGTPWALTVEDGEDAKNIVLEGISFGAKGDVYIVFTRGNEPTVPVVLSQFAATITAQNYVQITWTTQSESNISGYNIYRSANDDLGAAMQICPMIEGTNTSEECTYTYLDRELEQSGTYYYWLQNVELDGYVSFHGPVSVTFTAEGEGGVPDIPFVTKLENAYPNPFNPSTSIRYQLEGPGSVKIDIYNVRGQLVRSFSRTHDAAGYYQINWDGRDSSGKAVSSGVYQYKMTSGKYHSTKKMVLKK